MTSVNIQLLILCTSPRITSNLNILANNLTLSPSPVLNIYIFVDFDLLRSLCIDSFRFILQFLAVFRVLLLFFVLFKEFNVLHPPIKILIGLNLFDELFLRFVTGA